MPFSGISLSPGIGSRARFGPTRPGCALHFRSAIVRSVAVIITKMRSSATMLPTPWNGPNGRLSNSAKARTRARNSHDMNSRNPVNAPQPKIEPKRCLS